MQERSPVIAAGHPVKAEKVAVLTAPLCRIFVCRGLASSHLHVGKFINVEANLMK